MTQAHSYWYRIILMLVGLGAILAISHSGGKWLVGIVGLDAADGVKAHAWKIAAIGLALYTVLMVIPFMPGIEISLALFAAFGELVAVPIYLATLLALSVSFLIGRMVPIRLIAKLLLSFGLRNAGEYVRRLGPLNAHQRLETLVAHAPRRVVPTLLKHRYVAIAVALNVPGNALIGGGGGIALLAGLSGLFTFPRYLAIITLAALPIPLAFLVLG
jgi:hypothetical protein